MRYITNTSKAERLGAVRMTHCQSEHPEWAAREVQAVQVQNTRAKSDKTYHLILSFREEEQPEPATLKAIEDRICSALGYADHQRISAVHHDTDNLHVHIAINKIHPTRLTLHEPYYDHKKLGDLCAKLEREYGLQADNHQPRNTGQNAADMEAVSGIESLTGWIRRECLGDIQAAKSWDELHRTAGGFGLELKLRSNGLVFTSQDGTAVKASSVSRELSKAKLEAKLGPFQAPSQQRTETPRSGPDESTPRYQPRPRPSRVDTTELYARYQRDQLAVVAARAEASRRARDRKHRGIETAKRFGRLKRAAIKLTGGGRFSKRALYLLTSRMR